MAPPTLNLPVIRDGKPKEIVTYFTELRQQHPDNVICHALSNSVEDEYLPPSVLGIFFSLSKSPQTIAFCIYNAHSPALRKQAISHFGRVLADPLRWEEMWTAVGGAEALVNLLAKSSVDRLQDITRAIGSSNRDQPKAPARELAVEDLVMALLPSHYPGSKYPSLDKRPIQKHYSRLLPACSAPFIAKVLDAKDESNPLYQGISPLPLLKVQVELMRQRVLNSLFGDGTTDEDTGQYLGHLVFKQPARKTPGNPRVSETMAFSMKILQLRLSNIHDDERWSNAGVSEADILSSLLNRTIKKHLPHDQIHEVLMLGLKIFEAKPTLTRMKNIGLWAKILKLWRKRPDLYQDAVELSLQLQLSGSQKTISRDFYQTAKTFNAKPEWRWSILRLYCLNVPKLGIDIDQTEDFQILEGQLWASEIFFYLKKDEGIRLLQGLIAANPGYHFLQGPSQISIFGKYSLPAPTHFSATLLLTFLKRGSEETEKRAENAIEDLRRKAATSKEQTDRARFAHMATSYAIASGRLEIYGETITWQQRFARDPLTAKTVFGRDAIQTVEGIDLLAGIPKPLPVGMTFTEVVARVEQANEILMTFHSIMEIARREPSFYERDWSPIPELFGKVIAQRVEAAKELQKKLILSGTELYDGIWSRTLELLETVHVSFVQQASGPIGNLLRSLPPTPLAATTRKILQRGKERRKNEERAAVHFILERLSYDLILQLAQSDKPELAQELIVETILDRPDASSWHRQLLSIKFLKSLPALNAHKMLLSFASGISEKLEEQSYVKVGEAPPAKSAPPKSNVKVTTVKYLAQLLDKAEYISRDAAVDVLVELFKAGKHRDIRLATLDSLINLLGNICNSGKEDWRSNPLIDKIMGAIDTVVPIVGSINERRPPHPVEWEEARHSETVLEISEPNIVPPLLAAMLVAASLSTLHNMQDEFVSRFLLPILEASQAEHHKWVELFIRKHKATFKIDHIPPCPVNVTIWHVLISKFSALVPQNVVDDFNRYLIMTISPSSALQEFNKYLENNIDLKETPDVQHWLSLYKPRADIYVASGTQALVRLIHRDPPISTITDGIAFDKLLEMVVAHANLFLNDYEKYGDCCWKPFVDELRPPAIATSYNYGYSGKHGEVLRRMVANWQSTGRILLGRITALVEQRRKDRTGDNRHGILPSTTKLRMWMLPFPCFPSMSEVDGKCLIFAEELGELLQNFLEGDSNILRWPRITEDSFTVIPLINAEEERLRVAVYMGRLYKSGHKQNYNAMNFVRINLAMKLIEAGKGALVEKGKDGLSKIQKELMALLKKNISDWQNHDDEYVREKVDDWRKEQKELWKLLVMDIESLKEKDHRGAEDCEMESVSSSILWDE